MKFPIFHWQEPQPHNGEVPTSAKAPHGDPSPSEEMDPWRGVLLAIGPMATLPREYSNGFEDFSNFFISWWPFVWCERWPDPLPFHHLKHFRKGELNLLLSFCCFFASLLKRLWLEKRFGLLVNTQLTVVSETICCYLGQHSSIELFALMEMFCIYAFQYSNY